MDHRVIVIEFVTLDGVVEDPDGSGGTAAGGWAFRRGPEAVAGDTFRLGHVLETGVLLLGRTTWRTLGAIFPHREDDFGRAMTAMDKVVATRGRIDPSTWANTTVLDGDLITTVDRLRAERDVVITGSATLVEQLQSADRIDQYRLLVFPLLLGKGRRWFDGLPAGVDLDLVSVEDAGAGAIRQIHDRRR